MGRRKSKLNLKIISAKVKDGKLFVTFSYEIGDTRFYDTVKFDIMTLLEDYGVIPVVDLGSELFYTGWLSPRQLPEIPKMDNKSKSASSTSLASSSK